MDLLKTRRELLREALLAAGALTASGLLSPAAILAQEQKKKGKGRGKGKRGPAPIQGFRIGACDWTLGKRCKPEALEFAKKLGLDGVQVDVGGPDNFPLFDPGVQQQYLAAMKATGMQVPSLGACLMNSYPYFSDPRAQDWLSSTIDACTALGATAILLPFFGKGDLIGKTKELETTIVKLKEIAPKAEAKKVKVLVESYLDAPTLRKLVDAVASPFVGVYYDVGNTTQRGYSNAEEIKLLGSSIGEFHAKDYKALYGKGEVNFPAVRQAMDAVGYRGWLHMEGTKMPLGLEKSCQADAEYLRTVFPKQA